MKIFTYLSIVIGFILMSFQYSSGANLSIRKSGPSNANPGDLVTYTITYSNTVSTLEDNVVITDYLPDQVNCSYHSSFPTGVYDNVTNTITWNSSQIPGLASLDAGSGENTIQVTVRIGTLGNGINQSAEGYYLNASPATLSTSADIKSDQTTIPVVSDAVLTVVNYDCTFKISQPSAGIKSATGSTLTYLVALTNTGNIYQKYSLASTLFSGQHLDQSIQNLSGGAISETPFIAPGNTYLFHYVLTTPTGTKPNEYTETKIIATPNICGDSQDGIYKTFIYGGTYSNYELLSVYKIDTSDPVQSGSQLTYQVVISNVGSTLTNVRLKETYPANTSFVSASTSTSAVTTGNNIWDFASLPSGNTIITLTLDVENELPNGTILSNTVEVSSNGIIYDTYTETTTVVSAPDLSITKTALVVNSVAAPGSIVNYTLSYINNGNFPASDVVIKDNYDETYMTTGNIGTGIDAGGEISWSIPGSLAPGESGSIHYSMSIKNNAVLFLNGSTNIINSAVISSNLTDGNTSDNTASATVNVFVLPDLKIEKTADPSTAVVNQPITYTLSVSNIGKLDHTGSTYTVVDYLPAGTTYISSTPSGGIYNSGVVSWTISEDLPVNETKNFTVTLDALPCSFVGLGTLSNYATVHSNSYGDADNSNKEVTLMTDVIDNVKPTITFTDPITVNNDAGQCSAEVILSAPITDDNCGILSVTNDQASTVFPVGTTKVTWTVTDIHGNVTTAIQNVIVNDGSAPVPDMETLATLTGDCGVTVTAPTASDNCEGTITGTTTDPLTYSIHGTYTIDWNYDDGNGNTSTQSQTVVVEDITLPIMPVLADVTVGECSGTPVSPTTPDNCSGMITGTTTTEFPITTQGTTIVTWTFEDANGNVTTATQNVIVDDITAPVPDTETLATLTGECGVTVSAPTAMDNCEGTITATTTDPLTYSIQGTYTIDWIYNDGNGNTSTQSQTVVVDDITSPVPDVETLAALTGECGVTVSAPTASDNCKGTITGTTTDPMTYSAQGTYTITWTYDDGNGNTSTQSQTVVVDDITAPVPDTETLATLTGECGVTVSAPTAMDNCEGTITATTTDPLTYSAQGTYTIDWTYDDGNGNTSTQSQTVVVDDITAPVPDVETLATLTGECGVTVSAPSATDNCKGTITGTTTDPLTYSIQGTYTIDWIYDDGNGNTSTQSQTVVVDDITAPVPDVETLATLTGECGVTVSAPTATDNCEGTITATTTDPLTYSAQGTYTINWTYEDGNGNTSTQTQTVVVDDVTAPVLDVAFLPTLTGQYIVTVPVPTSTDNCEGSVTGTTTDPLTYLTQGTYTINWTYDDGNGNTSIQSQTVVVEDTTAPETPTLADVTVGECSGTPVAPITTDESSGVITGTTSTIFPITTQGKTIVTWTFEDGNGNVTTATQNVIVDDITPPVPDTETLATLTGECGVTVTAPTATDNCEGTITGTTTDPLTYTIQGTYTIDWIYDDGNGNTSTQSQTVVVDDITAPVPDVEDLATLTGECSITVNAPTATDYCKGTITGTTTDPLTYSIQGTYTIDWIYDDGNGNTSTQSQTVVVDDISSPVPDTETLATLTGECGVTVSAPTATDNCKGTITGTTTDPLTYSIQGTYTIDWTYDDGNGNTSTQTQTVVVEDITLPIMPVLADVTVGECSGTPVSPTTPDNCSGMITGTTTTEFPITTQGTTVVTWTFDDGNGNMTTATQNVVVDDISSPVPDAETLATFTGECSVTVSAPTATDNCEGIITATTTDPMTYSAQGTYTINWIYDDGNGNTSTQSQTVVVDDITAPVPDVETLATLSGECGVTVTAPTATDKCEGTITGTTTDPMTYSIQGTYTIDWTYDDGNGNTSTQSQTVVVDDITAPVPDVETLATFTGECGVTVSAPTATDNCKGTITGTTTDPLTYSIQGTYTIDWIYDDGNGNTSTQSQTVVVDDITSPVPDAETLATLTGECGVTVSAPTATDNCEGTITATTTDPLTYSAQGTYTINWIYDDGNGNTSTQSQTVVVDDITAPVPDVAFLPNLTGQYIVTVPVPTATDNCEGSVAGTTTDPLTYLTQGTYTINWTYDDGNGNTSIQSQTVVVEDTTAPETPTLADVTVGECSGTPVAPTTTNNGSEVITGTTTDVFPITTQGTTVVTWTFDYGNGNVTTATQNVIVDDITSPVPDVETLATLTGECGVTVSAPTATDNCKGTITGTTSDPLTYSAQGTYTITWTYDDGNGNTSTQTQTVVVDDITPPETPVLADVTLGECSGTPPTPTTIDNCKGTVYGTTSILFPKTRQGRFTILWTFDDGNGNVTTAYQNLIVDDVTAPVPDVASLPTLTGECNVTVTAPTATDNCEGTITGTTSDPLTYSAQGTYIITWTYDDGNGNTSTQSQTVVVDDITPPETPVLADVTLGECSGTPPTPTTIDNCKGTVYGTTSILFPKTRQGRFTILWTFDDGNGNVTTAYQNLIVDDVTAPVPDVASLPTLTGECNVTVTAPTAIDNCEGTITATTNDPLTYSAQGTYTIDWTYDDGNGNTSTQSQTVVVDDISSPVPDVETLATLTGECGVTVSAPTATDNCEGTIIATTTDPLTYSIQGTYIITWTYDDGNGNTSTQKQRVEVKDFIAPVPDTETLATLTGECGVTVSAPTATDNCKGTITGITTDPLTYTIQGTYTIDWTYDDGNGNTSTQSQTVVVDDITAPVPDVETLATLTGECGVTVSAPTATDNCKGTITGTTTDPLTYTIQGTYTIDWIYDDGNGNTATQSQTVEVKDFIAPVPDVETLATLTGECSVTVSAPTATDNCKGTITGTTTDPLTYSAQGTYTIDWIYDDGNGNTSTQTQTVVVDDITPPETPVLADVTLGECSGTPPTPTTIDNCKGTVYGTTSILFPKTKQGEFTILWTFDDGNGNVTTAYQNLIVDDVTAPVPDVASLPTLTGECNVTVTLPTATDNCKGTITGVTSDPLTYSAQGTYTITWTYDDGNGNTSTQTQTVVVDDITPPETPVLADVTLGECSGTPPTPTTIDNCKGTVYGTTSILFPKTRQGRFTILWTFDDGNGNVTTAYQNLIVDDVTAPVPDVASLPTLTGECSVTPVVPTATDNCSGVITGTTSSVFPITTKGTTVITWTYDDGNGNVTTTTQNVIVNDVTAPEITGTMALITVEGCRAEDVYPAEKTVEGLETLGLSISDACTKDAFLTVTSSDVVSTSDPLTVTRTYTITDASNNSSKYIQSITLIDTQNPSIIGPMDVIVNTEPGECKASAIALGTPITEDNCSISSVRNDAPAVFKLGTTIVTWTVSDKSGNTATCQQNVTVNGIPVANDDRIEMPENTQVEGNVTVNDEGLCDATITVSVHTAPEFGSLTIGEDGNYVYKPQSDYSGTDVFTYQLCDLDGDCSLATVEILINSSNGLPQANADTGQLQVDVVYSGDVTENDILSSDGNNVWTLLNPPSHGTISFHTDGTYTYTPVTGFIGSDRFTYQLCDASGDCSQAFVTISIEDVLLPNQILTPNDDGNNDQFIINGIEYYPVNKVTVYNRWGNVVYQKNNYQNEWDGFSNLNKVGSKPLPVGTYYYLIDYGNNRHKTGYVYLDR